MIILIRYHDSQPEFLENGKSWKSDHSLKFSENSSSGAPRELFLNFSLSREISLKVLLFPAKKGQNWAPEIIVNNFRPLLDRNSKKALVEVFAQTQTLWKCVLCTSTIYVVGVISHFTKTLIKVSTVRESRRDHHTSKVNHLALLGKKILICLTIWVSVGRL